jgi:hypothetical protein
MANSSSGKSFFHTVNRVSMEAPLVEKGGISRTFLCFYSKIFVFSLDIFDKNP